MDEQQKDVMLQHRDGLFNEHFTTDEQSDEMEGNTHQDINPRQQVFEIRPARERTVGIIAHVPRRRQGATSTLVVCSILSELMFAGSCYPHEDQETFYDRYEKAKGGNVDDDIEAYNRAEAKRQRKNAKRLKYAT